MNILYTPSKWHMYKCLHTGGMMISHSHDIIHPPLVACYARFSREDCTLILSSWIACTKPVFRGLRRWSPRDSVVISWSAVSGSTRSNSYFIPPSHPSFHHIIACSFSNIRCCILERYIYSCSGSHTYTYTRGNLWCGVLGDCKTM